MCKDFCQGISHYVQEVQTDVLGNTIAHKKGNGKKIMLVAHSDEVALMITSVDNDGFLHFKPYGCIDASLLPARTVKVLHNGSALVGVIGKRPIHLQRSDSETSKILFEDLWIDIGAKDKEEALTMVEIGDYAYFDSQTAELPNSLITGKSLDDRVGLSVLLQLAETLKDEDLNWNIYFVSSVQEEIGCRGAIAAAHNINPDYCIAIDVTHATDYPTMNPLRDGDIRLNGGCVIAKGPNIDGELFDLLKECAKSTGVKYQIEAIPYPTGTDANWVQVSNGGVKTALVSIPCRYMHTPQEIVSNEDVKSAIQLIKCFLCKK